jgi:hypothetical protein
MVAFFRSIELFREFSSIQPKIMIKLALIGFYTITVWHIISPVNANNLPADTDIPEEVLRAEIITEGRSPVDGKALSASDFAELIVKTKQQLERENAIVAMSGSKLKETLLLLRLRSLLRSIGVPIK